MTDLEVLTNCINEMARINIPAGLIEQIGLPIYNIRQELINIANSIIKKSNTEEKETISEANEAKDESVEVTIEEANQNGSEVE